MNLDCGDPPRPAGDDALAARLQLIVDSHRRLVGRDLLAVSDVPLPEALWRASRVIVAHGTEPDPVFFYGNALALSVFEMSFADFVRLPSRYSAEAVNREARAGLLARVARDGYIDDYSGVRISASGRRFCIEAATVWNLVAADGSMHGQAASFSRWQAL